MFSSQIGLVTIQIYTNRKSNPGPSDCLQFQKMIMLRETFPSQCWCRVVWCVLFCILFVCNIIYLFYLDMIPIFGVVFFVSLSCTLASRIGDTPSLPRWYHTTVDDWWMQNDTMAKPLRGISYIYALLVDMNASPVTTQCEWAHVSFKYFIG